MIAFNLIQFICDSGLFTPDNIYYGQIPHDKTDGIMITENGGEFDKDSCIYRTTIDVYAKYCSSVDAHYALYCLHDLLQGCVEFPEVTKECCPGDLTKINKHQYRGVIRTITGYESLEKDSSNNWIARWTYEITYYKKGN